MNFYRNNPLRRSFTPPPDAPTDFHRRLPGYAITPLVAVPELANTLSVSAVYVKDESHRLGLPAFKVLGASWAVHQLLEQRRGAPFRPWASFSELAEQLVAAAPLTLVTATDGNHGRAVARVAALLGLGARIAVPRGTADARVEGILSEGAEVVVVDGGYDDAVAMVSTWASDDHVIVSDTSWPGYEQIPGWIAEGYATLFREIDEQLTALGEPNPSLMVVPVGVGALAVAAARHFRQLRASRTALLSVEPMDAACVMSSAMSGAVVSEPGPHRSLMAGLNCGTPSMIAWPDMRDGFDAFMAIEDDRLPQAMRLLAGQGITAGETGAASVAALLELAAAGNEPQIRDHLGLRPDSVVVALCTEGATDPDTYQRLITGG